MNRPTQAINSQLGVARGCDRCESSPQIQEQQMVLPGLDRSEHYEVGLVLKVGVVLCGMLGDPRRGESAHSESSNADGHS
jgi:hypothetical protein